MTREVVATTARAFPCSADVGVLHLKLAIVGPGCTFVIASAALGADAPLTAQGRSATVVAAAFVANAEHLGVVGADGARTTLARRKSPAVDGRAATLPSKVREIVVGVGRLRGAPHVHSGGGGARVSRRRCSSQPPCARSELSPLYSVHATKRYAQRASFDQTPRAARADSADFS